jgi:hypothetical protein
MRFLRVCFRDMRGRGFREAASDIRATAFYRPCMSILALAGWGMAFGRRGLQGLGSSLKVVSILPIIVRAMPTYQA